MSKHSIRACVIVNARSSRAVADVSEALPILQAQGWKVEVRQKHHKGDAAKLAALAVGEGFDVVIACGGDGTVSEVVDGVAGTDVAVGTLPGGTANVWAHEIGVSMRPRVAAMQLAVSERLRIDIGRVSVNGHHGRHFLLMAGLGLDGAIMQRVSRRLKNRIGPLAVGLAAVESLPSFRAVPVRAELDGVHWQGNIAQIVVGNTRLYGGFTELTPDAYLDDGVLDVCFITPGGVIGTTRQTASLLFRRRPSEDTAELYRAARVTIHASQEIPLQLDGGAIHQKHEKLGADGLVYEFSAVPRAVTVLVPRTYDRNLLQAGAPRAIEDGPSGKKRKRKRKKDD